MDSSLLLSNLLNPAILFFFLGLLAVAAKSDLEIPQPISKFLSLYLLLAIGFKGGVELSHSGINGEIIVSLLAAVFMASIIPIYCFFIVKKFVSVHNASAIAATYGSISAVTFITAVAFLDGVGLPYSGYLVAAMALMESPAIIVGLIFHRLYHKDPDEQDFSWKKVWQEACFNGSVFLIMGSLIIGFLTTESHAESLRPFTNDMFKGVLAFFLLDMGLIAGKRLKVLAETGASLIIFSIAIPLLNALLGIAVATSINMSVGDALLFTVLCASASYIAVPAAMRLSIPQANPSLYVTMSLVITFPFNIIVGLPLYLAIIKYVMS